MAVTNNLLIFAANTENKMDDAAYASNSQRSRGVLAAEVVSSSLHNTAMRSTTLLLKCLVNGLIGSSLQDEGSISTNTPEEDANTLFLKLFSALHTARADGDGDGANIAKTYATDLHKTDVNGSITLQLLAKTATGGSRAIGSAQSFDVIAKSNKVKVR